MTDKWLTYDLNAVPELVYRDVATEQHYGTEPRTFGTLAITKITSLNLLPNLQFTFTPWRAKSIEEDPLEFMSGYWPASMCVCRLKRQQDGIYDS